MEKQPEIIELPAAEQEIELTQTTPKSEVRAITGAMLFGDVNPGRSTPLTVMSIQTPDEI